MSGFVVMIVRGYDEPEYRKTRYACESGEHGFVTEDVSLAENCAYESRSRAELIAEVYRCNGWVASVVEV